MTVLGWRKTHLISVQEWNDLKQRAFNQYSYEIVIERNNNNYTREGEYE